MSASERMESAETNDGSQHRDTIAWQKFKVRALPARRRRESASLCRVRANGQGHQNQVAK